MLANGHLGIENAKLVPDEIEHQLTNLPVRQPGQSLFQQASEEERADDTCKRSFRVQETALHLDECCHTNVGLIRLQTRPLITVYRLAREIGQPLEQNK